MLGSVGISVRRGEVRSGAWVSWVLGGEASHGNLGFRVTGGGRRDSGCQRLEIGVGLGLDHGAGDAGNLTVRTV